MNFAEFPFLLDYDSLISCNFSKLAMMVCNSSPLFVYVLVICIVQSITAYSLHYTVYIIHRLRYYT